MKQMNLTVDQALDMLEAEMKSVDSVFPRLLDNIEKKEKRAVSCRNCTQESPGCCYQKTMAYAQEGLVIGRYLRQHGLDTPALRAELRAAGEEMEGYGRTDWFHGARRPCVFLKGGKCSIYPVRPHACRTYYVISESFRCQPGCDDGILFLDVGQFQGVFVQQTRAIHRAFGLIENEQRLYLGAMPRVVAIALESGGDPRAYRRALNREPWPGLDKLEEWIDGENPHREKLVQIRRKEAAP